MAVPFSHGAVKGFLHNPDGRTSLALTHGAGGNSGMALLAAVAEAFATAGWRVLRFDLPFRQRRPHGPPSPAGAAADREGIRAAVDLLRGTGSGQVFLGGQSYGGRQASMLAAEDPAIAAGLLLLSYPLHPPGKPERLRTEHFPALRLPVLFVSGERDPFASPDELRSAAELVPEKKRIIEVAGAGHELANGRLDAAKLIVGPFEELITTRAAGE